VRRPIVLFDLDGTIVTFEGASPGPGRQALDRAIVELYAVRGSTDGLRVAGGTDRALARAILSRAGVVADEPAIDRVLAAYLVHLEAILRTRRYRPVGDVTGSVSMLLSRGARVGIATGNVRDGARMKLASAGLSASFDLALGGFGCDAEPRAEIVRLAAERCKESGHAAEIVVVGDTEHDVRAGRAVGARVVGVALSARARKELEAAGADAVVDRCGDELVNAVLG
jgi:phosphoglycolate phosphatase-like HAD superfamily hydrolase